MMVKALLALGAAAVAVTAMPAEAGHHITGPVTCAHWRHGVCVAARPRYNVGYAFRPNFGYTTFDALPSPYAGRYHLRNNFRYVNQNGYIYVVNPRTNRVVRVIPEF